ncbi:MAG: homocysteine S-methyltransferase family protein [Pseudomonadota bacterium]
MSVAGFSQLMSGDRPFLTDAGLETWLVFHKGLDLPCFAAFGLVQSDEGRRVLSEYYADMAALSAEQAAGFVFEAPTWRANSDWGAELGYDASALAGANADAIAFLKEMATASGLDDDRIVISGNIGPRGDGYRADDQMTAAEAEAYHSAQIRTFADAGADVVTAMTLNYVNEAVGVARAAKAAGLPCVIAFTVETDGKLPTGETLQAAIAKTDANTDGSPAYYMVNCAHPTHFETVLEDGALWTERLRGLRANASKCSHAELDEAEELDDGDPEALAGEYVALRRRFPRLTVLGGCCGTDIRHIRSIAKAVCASA